MKNVLHNLLQIISFPRFLTKNEFSEMKALKQYKQVIKDLQISDVLGNQRIFVVVDNENIPNIDKEGKPCKGDSFGVNTEQFFNNIISKDMIVKLYARCRVGRTPNPSILGLIFVDAEITFKQTEVKAGETYNNKVFERDAIATDIIEINVPKLDQLFIEEIQAMKSEWYVTAQKAVKNPFA